MNENGNGNKVPEQVGTKLVVDNDANLAEETTQIKQVACPAKAAHEDLVSRKRALSGAGEGSNATDTNNNAERLHSPNSSSRLSSNDVAGIKALDRMALAHAIALDDSFQVKGRTFEPGTVEAQVESTVRKAFWDSFRRKIEAVPADYSAVLMLILEAKQTLLSFIVSTTTASDQDGKSQHGSSASHDIRERIERELNRQWLERQIANNAIDLVHYADILVGFMAELCAPVRDEEIEQVRKAADVVQKYCLIFQILDHMRLDYANFQIQLVRPVLKRISHEYERDKFETYRQAAAVSLPSSSNALPGVVNDTFKNTKAWLLRSAKQLLLDGEPQEETQDGNSSSQWLVSPTAVLFNAFVNLIDDVREPAAVPSSPSTETDTTDTLAEQYSTYPETLALDFEHLVACRLRFHDLTVLASVLVTIINNPGVLRCIRSEDFFTSHQTLTTTTLAKTKEVTAESSASSPAVKSGQKDSTAIDQKQAAFISSLKNQLDLVVVDTATDLTTKSKAAGNSRQEELQVLERVADFVLYKFSSSKGRVSQSIKCGKRSKTSGESECSTTSANSAATPERSASLVPLLDEEESDLLHAQIVSLASSSNAVRMLIASRLRRYFYSLLHQLYTKSTAATAAPAASSASRRSSASAAAAAVAESVNTITAVKIPAGFQALTEDVERLASVYMRLIAHNQATFGKDYAQIIRDFAVEAGIRRPEVNQQQQQQLGAETGDGLSASTNAVQSNTDDINN